ncbi:hypothetical protein ACOMHN_029936 [Nucella lapillus]
MKDTLNPLRLHGEVSFKRLRLSSSADGDNCLAPRKSTMKDTLNPLRLHGEVSFLPWVRRALGIQHCSS